MKSFALVQAFRDFPWPTQKQIVRKTSTNQVRYLHRVMRTGLRLVLRRLYEKLFRIWEIRYSKLLFCAFADHVCVWLRRAANSVMTRTSQIELVHRSLRQVCMCLTVSLCLTGCADGSTQASQTASEGNMGCTKQSQQLDPNILEKALSSSPWAKYSDERKTRGQVVWDFLETTLWIPAGKITPRDFQQVLPAAANFLVYGSFKGPVQWRTTNVEFKYGGMVQVDKALGVLLRGGNVPPPRKGARYSSDERYTKLLPGITTGTFGLPYTLFVEEGLHYYAQANTSGFAAFLNQSTEAFNRLRELEATPSRSTTDAVNALADFAYGAANIAPLIELESGHSGNWSMFYILYSIALKHLGLPPQFSLGLDLAMMDADGIEHARSITAAHVAGRLESSARRNLTTVLPLLRYIDDMKYYVELARDALTRSGNASTEIWAYPYRNGSQVNAYMNRKLQDDQIITWLSSQTNSKSVSFIMLPLDVPSTPVAMIEPVQYEERRKAYESDLPNILGNKALSDLETVNKFCDPAMSREAAMRLARAYTWTKGKTVIVSVCGNDPSSFRCVFAETNGLIPLGGDCPMEAYFQKYQDGYRLRNTSGTLESVKIAERGLRGEFFMKDGRLRSTIFLNPIFWYHRELFFGVGDETIHYVGEDATEYQIIYSMFAPSAEGRLSSDTLGVTQKIWANVRR